MTRAPWLVDVAAFLGAVALALALGAGALLITGTPVLPTYASMFSGSIGSLYGLQSSIGFAVPIAFCALAAAVAFRAQVWNIGGEGQLLLGTFGTTLAALYLPVPEPLMLPAVILAAAAAGALWGLLPGVLKVWLGVNEVLSSLMLNYVALLWIDFLVFGPWKDPAMAGWPYSKPFPPGAMLPQFGTSGLNLSLVLALGVAVVFAVMFRYSRWGFETTVIGYSHAAARYAAMNVARKTVQVMLISGAVAGLAGLGEVSGAAGRLYHMSPGYGYVGILVSWLASHNPLLIPFAALFYGVLIQGGSALQIAQVDPSLVRILQAAIILFALAALTLTRRYRLARIERRAA